MGGTYDHKLLIDKLVCQGSWVILADYSDNPVARAAANEYFKISTTDIPALEKLCRDFGINLVLSACVDSSLEPALVLSQRLGLPHHFGVEKLPFISNKGLMKGLFSKYQIPSSNFLLIRQNEIGKIDSLKFPIVVKPIGTSSSKGVFRVNGLERVASSVNEAFELTRGDKIIVEEFVEGEELTVDVWVTGGNAQVLMISKIKKSIHNPDLFTINSNLYDPVLAREVLYPISLIAQALVEALDYLNGPLLFQLIRGDFQFSVLETSVRMGGGSKVSLIKEVTGIDLLDAYISLYFGKSTSIKNTVCDHWVEMVYFYSENGLIANYSGFEEAKKEGMIEDFFIYKLEGIQVTGSSVSSDRPAGVMIKAGSQEELNSKKSKVFDRISICNPEGDNLLKKWF